MNELVKKIYTWIVSFSDRRMEVGLELKRAAPALYSFQTWATDVIKVISLSFYFFFGNWIMCKVIFINAGKHFHILHSCSWYKTYSWLAAGNINFSWPFFCIFQMKKKMFSINNFLEKNLILKRLSLLQTIV